MSIIIYTLNLNDITKTGLSLSFSVFNKVSDDSVVASPIITELGSGFYKFTFDAATVDSDIYFVADDGGSNVVTGRIDRDNASELSELVTRTLGLMQENQFVDNTVYDGNGNLTSSRVRIYSNAASVGC